MLRLLLTFCVLLLPILAGERTLSDMAGRTVTLPENVTRVVTIGGTPALNTFIFAMGKGETIKNGIGDSKLRRMPFWKHQAYFAPEIFTLPQVSSQPPQWIPDMEKLAAIPFDVGFVNDPVMAEQLTKKGFPVAVVNWQGADSIQKSMDFLAAVYNEPEHAVRYRAYYQNVLMRVAHAMKGYSGAKRSGLYLRLETLSLPMVTTANTVIQHAGGVASAAEIPVEHATINIEKLLTWNPDTLFVWSKKDQMAAYSDPKFANLKAVKNRNIHITPMGTHIWMHYTPEQPLAILWAAKKLYPERFETLNLKEETRAFYRTFMKKELTDEQVLGILRGIGGEVTTPLP